MFGMVVEELNRLWSQQKRVHGLMGNPKFRYVWNELLYYANAQLNEQPIGSTMRIGNALMTHIPRSISAILDIPTEDGMIYRSGISYTSFADACAKCPTATLNRLKTGGAITFGGRSYQPAGGIWISEIYGRAYVEWLISVLPPGLILSTNPVFRYDGYWVKGVSQEINPISSQPSVTSDAGLFADIASGTAYVDPFNIGVGAGQEVDLGASARSDLQAAVNAKRSWFAIGLQSPDNECPCAADVDDRSGIYTKEWSGVNPPPTLYVEFDFPGPPTPPGSTMTDTQAVSSGSRHIETPYIPYSISLTTDRILRHVTKRVRG